MHVINSLRRWQQAAQHTHAALSLTLSHTSLSFTAYSCTRSSCSPSPAPCSPLRCKPAVPLPSPMPTTASKSSNPSTMRHFSISLCSSTPTASQQASGPLPSLISSTRKQASKLQQCSPPLVPPLLLSLEQSNVTPAATGRTSRSMSTTPTPNHRRPRRAVPRAVAPTSPTTKPSCRRRAVCRRTASLHHAGHAYTVHPR